MPKRALDVHGCIDGDSEEADSMLSGSVVIGSASTDLDMPHVASKDEDEDTDRRSECSAVVESSTSDETSLQTDGSTDAPDPCCTGT